MPLESLPPFILIIGGITAMGLIHQGVNLLSYGKPKALGMDDWDRMLELRDKQLKADAKAASKAKH